MERNHLKGASDDAINVILAAAGHICQTGSISPPSTTNATPAGSPTASTQGHAPSPASKHRTKSLWLSSRNPVMRIRVETAYLEVKRDLSFWITTVTTPPRSLRPRAMSTCRKRDGGFWRLRHRGQAAPHASSMRGRDLGGMRWPSGH